ncbi:ATP-binding cassette sub-family G member 2 [Fukomys damarensis]|uniref:ATP-binding cassette sub-family G member 2 n=1 Tax=Fukomys damarensis TaxID=885580 RepID=A0A091DB78_FUKDA|nr:ATP-binding cassette sub-family G member 2 [Fukomys damarensis]
MTMTHLEKEERINKVIEDLGLNKVADSKVGTKFTGGLSGAERKTTSIAMELIMDPSILFLDEPTNGLDSNTAHAVLSLLKMMSSQGRTIIISIHQPRYSIFKLFDSLTLLASGKLMFHGPAQEAVQYFASAGSLPVAEGFLIMTFTLMMVRYSASSLALAIAVGQNGVSITTLLMNIYFLFMMIFLAMSLYFEAMAPQLLWLQYLSIPHYGFMVSCPSLWF